METMVAMAVLSIGIVTVNRALYQVLLTRAVAQDYTVARYFLEQTIAPYELQPILVETVDEGTFGEAYPRFRWDVRVDAIEVPLPALPPELPEEMREALEADFRYMGRVTARVHWTRAGTHYRRTAVTLISADRIWIPEVELAR